MDLNSYIWPLFDRLVLIGLLTGGLLGGCVLQGWGLAMVPFDGAPGKWQGWLPYVLLPSPASAPDQGWALLELSMLCEGNVLVL